MVKVPTPEPMSVPDHWTVKVGEVSSAGSRETLLVGGVLSTVLAHGWVSMGALVPKTTLAWSEICVPVARPCFGFTVKKTLAAAPGGRKPTKVSVGGKPVVGSMEVKGQVI